MVLFVGECNFAVGSWINLVLVGIEIGMILNCRSMAAGTIFTSEIRSQSKGPFTLALQCSGYTYKFLLTKYLRLI